MRTPSNIRIVPYRDKGFVVEWQMTPAHPDEFKTLQNRAQLIRVLELILDEAEEGYEL